MIKVLRFSLGLIAIISIVAIINIFNRYSEINEFSIQMTENYADLKKLNDKIIELNGVELKANEKLHELHRIVQYNEHMLSVREPNAEITKNYPWIIIALIWLIVLIRWVDDKIKPSKKESHTE